MLLRVQGQGVDLSNFQRERWQHQKCHKIDSLLVKKKSLVWLMLFLNFENQMLYKKGSITGFLLLSMKYDITKILGPPPPLFFVVAKYVENRGFCQQNFEYLIWSKFRNSPP